MSELSVLLFALSDTELADINAAIALILGKLNFLKTLTPEERKEYRAIAMKRLGYMTGVHAALTDFGGVVPQSFSVPDFTTQKTLRENLHHVGNQVGSLKEGIDDTILILDDTLLKRADMGYDYLKTGVKGDEALSEIVDDIAAFHAHKTRVAAKIVTIAARAMEKITNVKARTLLYNKGNGPLKFKAGAELASKTKQTWKYVGPGEAVLIPVGWTILEVVNDSTTEVGLISVRKD